MQVILNLNKTHQIIATHLKMPQRFMHKPTIKSPKRDTKKVRRVEELTKSKEKKKKRLFVFQVKERPQEQVTLGVSI